MLKILYCLITAAICYVAAKFGRKIIDKIFSLTKFGKNGIIKSEGKVKTLKTVTTSVVIFIVYFIGVLSILSRLGVSDASLTAVSGSVAVAIGLGAQNVVSDIIAGIFILVEEQFNVGDIVEINGCTGTVESVTMRTTRLRDVDGTVYIVPNGTISTVVNKCKDFINAVVDVGISYEDDADNAIEVLKDEMAKAYAESDGMLEEPNVLGITGLDDSAVTIRIVVKCRIKENYKVERDLRLRIKKRFDADGITIPYPQRTVRIING